MANESAHFDGTVSMKRTFLWSDRRLVVFSGRIEYSQPERPNIPKTVVKVQNITLSPIVRHHGHFEFTMFSSELGYLQRVRIRAHELSETERIHSIIQRVKMLSSPPNHQSSRYRVDRRKSEARSTNRAPLPSVSNSVATGIDTTHFLMFTQTSPHVTLNLVIVALVGLTTFIAPILNSLVLTMTLVLSMALIVAIVLNYYSIDIPSLHLIITTSPHLYQTTRGDSFSEASGGLSTERAREEALLEDREETGSRSSSINELGYSTPIPGSPEHRARSFVMDQSAEISVLLSESSKFMSSFASMGDYRMCYSIMWSMSETVISLLKTQPAGIAPPADVQLVASQGVYIDYSIKIVADDAEFTKSEWTTIRNKGGLTVLTSKLSSSLTRWPVISAVSTVNARLDEVYRSISIPEIFKKVDEFAGSYRMVEYNELASGAALDQSAAASLSPANGGKESPDEEITLDLLRPETAPLLFKYQEMKSVWPVQPRDYFALNSGFLLALDDGRRGKFYIAKSSDPHPKDPFPTGHEGFVRGSLTSSCFLLIENAKNPAAATDVWTFLHCDMKGNLSGNGKIADFITQSQMPKFFARLETVSASCAPEMGLIK
jgi:hypothetical protein